jgi:hypothetical protein
MLLYDVHNPTAATRVISDARNKPVRIESGETIAEVPLSQDGARRLIEYLDDLIIVTSEKNVAMLYDIHNPTKTTRIVHDGVPNSNRMIRVDPGQTLRNVFLGDLVVKMIQSRVEHLKLTPASADGVASDQQSTIIAPPLLSTRPPRTIPPPRQARMPQPQARPSVVPQRQGVTRRFDLPANVTRDQFRWSIAIPSWRPEYVDLTVKYVIPSVLASLGAAGIGPDRVTFNVWTDDRERIGALLSGWNVEYPQVSLPNYHGKKDPLPKEYWAAFMQAHADAMNIAKPGEIIVLLNADIVVSRETFDVVGKALEPHDKRVAISVGIRTVADNNDPPIGADAETLTQYIWSHRHPITNMFLWGKGDSGSPSVLFFEDGDDVTMHCFHLTPMFIKKDRDFKFRGTIDDDVLQNYQDGEVAFLNDRQCCFCEMSYAYKDHHHGKLDFNSVLTWARRRTSPAHKRNFRQRFKVLGNPTKNHPVAQQIIDALR